MARSLSSVTTSRNGAVAIGIGVAILAAILLVVYVTRYKSSVDESATPTPVLVAKRLIPKGTQGSTVAQKQLYQSTAVPSDSVQSGAISDPNALVGRTALTDIYPGAQLTTTNFSAEASTALNAQLSGQQRAVSLTIDSVKGSLANVASGDHVDIYTQLTRNNRTVIQLFRSNVTVLQAPGVNGGTVVLQARARDAANFLYAANQTTLYFTVRPASGAAPTPGSLADLSTVIATSRSR